jgi:hypothetical protein
MFSGIHAWFAHVLWLGQHVNWAVFFERFTVPFILASIVGVLAAQGAMKIRDLVKGVADDEEESDSKAKSKSSPKKKARAEETALAGARVDQQQLNRRFDEPLTLVDTSEFDEPIRSREQIEEEEAETALQVTDLAIEEDHSPPLAILELQESALVDRVA